MRSLIAAAVLFAVPLAGMGSARAQPETARPDPPVLKQLSTEYPKADQLETRVMTATLQPGTASPWHTHAAPVTVYVLEGTFTLELENRAPITLKAGQALLEPINVKMRAANHDPVQPAKVVIFQVSRPEDPFLHPAH